MKKIYKCILCCCVFLMIFVSTPTNIQATASWSGGLTITSNGNTFRFTSLTNSGDATLLQISGKVNRNILIDAGNYGANVGAALVNKGVRRLDTVIITHNDPDHINGIHKFKSYGITISNLYLAYPYSKKTIATTGINALDMVKKLKTDGVLTNKATRIMDTQNHSGVGNNVNMGANDTYYLRICRGRLFKLNKMAEDGFDLTIIPPMTDITTGSWSINNSSMMVVFETSSEKVVFGGDVQATGMVEINKIQNGSSSSIIAYLPSDAYSYYYGVKNILFANTWKYTVYKVSHHGTGTNRVYPTTSSTLGTFNADSSFINYLKPDVLIMSGHMEDSQAKEKNYFNNITSVAKYRTFSAQALLN